jgi:ribonucleoside-diphosphate reductase alpha chain
VNITDEFMEAVINDQNSILQTQIQELSEIQLKLANCGNESLKLASELAVLTLTLSTQPDEAYQKLKKLGLSINGSNLCNEIHLATSEERTAVCCLSSVNLEKYDEWKASGMVGDLIRFLDNVLQYFIDNAPEELSKAVYSAYRERSSGLEQWASTATSKAKE